MRKTVFCLEILLTVGLLGGIQHAEANAIRVTTAGDDTLNLAGSYAEVQFDLAWNNSWRVSAAPSNWDAAWVFVKYRTPGSDWHHATLAAAGHSGPAAATIDRSSDGMGALIYRSSDGTGDVSFADITLRWDCNVDGLTLNTGDQVDISIHAIEMVYIPEGAFWVGDGRTSDIHGIFEAGTSGNAFPITSEGALTLGGASTNNLNNNDNTGLWSIPDDFGDATTTNLPAAFPKGYQAFYCQKYETSQGQYTDFLNKLTATQDGIHFPNKNGQFRHTIGGSAGARTVGVPDRALNYTTWSNMAAYADWAALRPMTELEFEKVCRGPATPIPLDYAWGSTNINVSFRYTYSNDGQSNATLNAVSGTGNLLTRDTDPNYNGGDNGGPCRCGIFAASTADPTREEAGAGYYGVMELSGNCSELVVCVGHGRGRAFQGTHGDGELTAAGLADVSDWPGYDAGNGAVHDWQGTGGRGGNLTGGGGGTAPLFIVSVSDRIFANAEKADHTWILDMNKVRDWGANHFVRTAP